MHGSCLCGAVAFDAEPSELHSHACHCDMCRRWSGSAFLAVPVPAGKLAVADPTHVRAYASSDWAERAFCDVCGSHLYYRLKLDGPQHGQMFVALGLFDEPDRLPLASEIYIDRKPASFAFAGERKRLTAAEVEAMMMGGESG